MVMRHPLKSGGLAVSNRVIVLLIFVHILINIILMVIILTMVIIITICIPKSLKFIFHGLSSIPQQRCL